MSFSFSSPRDFRPLTRNNLVKDMVFATLYQSLCLRLSFDYEERDCVIFNACGQYDLADPSSFLPDTLDVNESLPGGNSSCIGASSPTRGLGTTGFPMTIR